MTQNYLSEASPNYSKNHKNDMLMHLHNQFKTLKELQLHNMKLFHTLIMIMITKTHITTTIKTITIINMTIYHLLLRLYHQDSNQIDCIIQYIVIHIIIIIIVKWKSYSKRFIPHFRNNHHILQWHHHRPQRWRQQRTSIQCP